MKVPQYVVSSIESQIENLKDGIEVRKNRIVSYEDELRKEKKMLEERIQELNELESYLLYLDSNIN